MKWITWNQQDELANLIWYWIDKGSHRNQIVADANRDYPNKYTEKQINTKINELIEKWLIFEVDEELHVTEFSHSSLMKAMNDDFENCLIRLKKLKIYHPDMLSCNIIEKRK